MSDSDNWVYTQDVKPTRKNFPNLYVHTTILSAPFVAFIRKDHGGVLGVAYFIEAGNYFVDDDGRKLDVVRWIAPRN